MSYVRTPEHRRPQSEAIHRWRPWEQSTGPRSPEGKRRSSQNAYKGSKPKTARACGFNRSAAAHGPNADIALSLACARFKSPQTDGRCEPTITFGEGLAK